MGNPPETGACAEAGAAHVYQSTLAVKEWIRGKISA